MMPKVYFYYSAMNAGKSSTLLQAEFNYREKGFQTLCFLPEVAFQFCPHIISRIGLKQEAVSIKADAPIKQLVSDYVSHLGCIFIDEAQFLSQKNVQDFCWIADHLNIPVMAFGLRTDFRGDLFPGTQALLSYADEIKEIKTICFCGKKAIMTARMSGENNKIDQTSSIDFTLEGDQILCGGNQIYLSFCRKHYYERVNTSS